MGRHAGWIAIYGGHGRRRRRHPRARACRSTSTRCAPAHPAPPPPGATFSIVVVAEGAMPRRATMARVRAARSTRSATSASAASASGSPSEIEERTGFETPHDDPRPRPAWRHPDRLRPRAGHPLRRRRHRRRGRRRLRQDGRAARGCIERVPIADALREPKLLDPALYETAEVFFGVEPCGATRPYCAVGRGATAP